MNPGVLDYILGAVILVATVRCVLKGFVAEIIAVAAVGGGIVCGVVFSTGGATLVARLLGESVWNRVIAFLVIFLTVYLVLKIAEGLLYRLLEAVHLENLDRALGFFWGLAEGLVVSVLILLVLENQPFVDMRQMLDESLFAQFIVTLLPPAGGGDILIPLGEIKEGV